MKLHTIYSAVRGISYQAKWLGSKPSGSVWGSQWVCSPGVWLVMISPPAPAQSKHFLYREGEWWCVMPLSSHRNSLLIKLGLTGPVNHPKSDQLWGTRHYRPPVSSQLWTLLTRLGYNNKSEHSKYFPLLDIPCKIRPDMPVSELSW